MKMTDKSWDEVINICIEKSRIKDVNGFRSFMKEREHLGYMFDYHLYARAYHISKSLFNDYDHFTVISGYEGMGKTTLAAQLSAVVSPHSFRLNSICMEMDEFIRALQNAKVGDTFQLDEGALFLFSREAMSGDSRVMVKLFTIMRQKNLHVVICIPNFFTIDSYIRDHRVGTLIQVSARGKYTAYTGKAIKIISKEGARYKNVGMVRVPNGTFWRGYFHKDLPLINDITPQSYKEFKATHMSKFLDDIQLTLKNSVNEPEYVDSVQAAKILNLDYRTVINYSKKGLIDGKKIGSKWFIRKKNLDSLGMLNNKPDGERITKGVGGDEKQNSSPIIREINKAKKEVLDNENK